MHCNCHSLVHRALVTYSNERTGEIRVRVPAVTGLGEMSISKIARTKHNNVWVVPNIGSQILVSADDENMTNLFWIHSDVEEQSSHFRNYFEAYSTASTSATLTGGVGDAKPITYNTVIFNEGIRLVDGSKMTFDYEGIYNFQYSIQWQNTDSQAHDTVVWIEYNGNPFPDSATYASIPSKHGSVNGTTVTAINFVGKAFEGDYIELYWSGNSTNLSIHTINAGEITTLSPLSPTAPSVIVTVTQVA
jgi:hypothetical protein